MKTGAAYIRVSTDEQVEFSPDSQLRAIKNYAEGHDIFIPEDYIFIDEGISGRKADKRPSFQQMIFTAKLRPKPFDVILLWKFSRFARNREDSIVYKSMLRKQCGIEVISVSEQLSEDKTSILIEAMIEAMDEYYSLNLAEEVRRGMNEKFSRGGMVSQPPFGYRAEKGMFLPDENTAPAVRMIFEDFNNGMGIRSIAEKLNRLGIRTSKGGKFENRSVEYILTNVTYLGKLRRSKNGRSSDRFHTSEDTVVVEGLHEPLISQEVFDSAQSRRSLLKKSFGKYAHHGQTVHILKGLVRCSACGSTMVYQSAGKSLQCHSYSKGRCSVSHCISVKKLTQAVLEKIRNDFADLPISIDISVSAPDEMPSENFEQLIQKENDKLARVREAYESGIDSLAEYRENKNRITKRITSIKSELANTHDHPIKTKRTSLHLSFSVLDNENVSPAIRNLILRTFIDKIIFQKTDHSAVLYYKL